MNVVCPAIAEMKSIGSGSILARLGSYWVAYSFVTLDKELTCSWSNFSCVKRI